MFAQWRATNFRASEQLPSVILGAMSEYSTFVPSGKYLIGLGAEIRLKFLFWSYFTNKASFML